MRWWKFFRWQTKEIVYLWRSSIGSDLTRMIAEPGAYQNGCVRSDHAVVKMKEQGTPTSRAQPAASRESFPQEMDQLVDQDTKICKIIYKMSIMTKLRCITLDFTGTLIAYKGDLGDYYCMAAKSVGLPCPDCKRVHEGFKIAYTNIAKEHPCFGFAEKIPNIVWWKTCVRDSFVKAGYDYDEETFEKVFKRIYSTFGSAAPYTMFSDSKPFLRWARDEGLLVGLVSNAEYRYRDVILPAMGLNQGSEYDFGVFSGLEGFEKPDPEIYKIALKRAGNIAPEEVLHIGDSMRKDYVPAKSIGMHALLLDRFKTPDAEEWRKSGATVLPDLVAAQEWLTSDQSTIQ